MMKKEVVLVAIIALVVAAVATAISPIALGKPGKGGGKGRGGGGGQETITATIALLQCDGSIAKWRDSSPDGLQNEVRYKIVDEAGVGEKVIASVRRGVGEWNKVQSVYSLQETLGAGDITIRLYYKVVPGYILGYASVCPFTSNGDIESAEIYLGVKGLQDIGVQNLAAHETGHVLGLSHADYKKDLMYASFDQKEERKSVVCPSNLDAGALTAEAGSYTVTDWQRLAC